MAAYVSIIMPANRFAGRRPERETPLETSRKIGERRRGGDEEEPIGRTAYAIW